MKKLLLAFVGIMFVIFGANAQYCVPNITDCTLDDQITNVTFAGINNNSTCSTNGYQSYPLTATVTTGTTVPISVRVGPGGTEYVVVWIDYNQNNTFDASEYTIIGSGNGVTISNSIVIPASATPGNTKMRVRVRFNTQPTATEACTTAGLYGEVEDYNVNIVGAAACTGTPNPGNTTSTVTTVCPSISFTLSTQNNTPGSGVTYQWQSATVLAGPYTNITGATNSTYTTTQTTATFYRVIVTCSGNTGTSNPVQVLLTPPSGCYCASNATNSADEDIIRVQVSTLNNSSTCTTLAPGPGSVLNRYSNYTSGTGAPSAPNLVQGSNEPFQIQIGTCGFNFGNSIAVWIDFNQNGNFEANERVYVSPSGTSGPHTESGNFAIPATATLGTTRMRVVNVETGTPTSINACGTYTYGETEDYLVNIVPCVPALVTTDATNQTVTCGTNATFSAVISGSSPTFQWQVRSTPTAVWTNVVNGAPYSGATSNTLNVAASTALNGYAYRLTYSNCGTALSFTNPVTLTVAPIIATFTQTPTTLCAGDIQTINVTGGGTGVFTPTTNLFTDAAATVPYTGNAVSTVYAKPTATTTYSVVVTNGACASNATSILVTVNVPIGGTATLPAAASVCANASTTLSLGGITSGTGLTYQWQVNTLAAPTVFNNITNGGIYAGATTVSLTITNPPIANNGLQYRVIVTSTSCGTTSTSNALILTVNTIPVVSISTNTNTIQPGTTATLTANVTAATAPIAYQWFRNGVAIPGATANTYVADVNGLGAYTVRVNDANLCNAVSSTPVDITLSASASNTLYIYPSPNSGSFQVRYYNANASATINEATQLNVYDSKGSRVFTQRYTIVGPYTQMRVNLGVHNAGIYRVELTNNRGERIKTGSVIVF